MCSLVGAGIRGESAKLGDVFIYKHKDFHVSTQTVVEFIPTKKLVWKVSNAKISFVKNKSEWDGSEIVFAVTPGSTLTEVKLTHIGLTPKLECYGDCSNGWNHYFGMSLKALIETGIGKPDPKGFAD